MVYLVKQIICFRPKSCYPNILRLILGCGNIRRAWPGNFVMEGMIFAGPHFKLRLRTTHLPDFSYDERFRQYPLLYQVRGLCVGGDMVILP